MRNMNGMYNQLELMLLCVCLEMGYGPPNKNGCFHAAHMMMIHGNRGAMFSEKNHIYIRISIGNHMILGESPKLH